MPNNDIGVCFMVYDIAIIISMWVFCKLYIFGT